MLSIFTSQLVVNGSASQGDIRRAFGVPKVAVQRAYADWRRYPQYIVPLSESSIDLIFAPAFGTPENAKATMAAGQLARLYKLPYRASNARARDRHTASFFMGCLPSS